MKLKREQKILLSIIVVLLVPIFVFSVMLYKHLNPDEKVYTTNIANIDWYDENAEEFVITTPQELVDLTVLSDFYDFAGQTIKLGADIVVNEGNAEDWEKHAPANRWDSISGFAGTFDGQGHTISGLYGKTIDKALGVFSNVKKGSVIQNFKLVNSYFEAEGNSRLASIVGGDSKGSTVKQVYTDAILNYRGDNCGGIVAYVSGDTLVEECWFDGTIQTRGWVVGGIVGIVSNSTATVQHCLSTGSISSTFTEAGARVGGLCGFVKKYGTVKIEDSLSACEIDVLNESQNGSVMGYVNYNTTLELTDVYAAKETYVTASNVNASGTQNGHAVTYHISKLIGNGGYQWTTLDFEKYWTVDLDDTPILQCFAEEVPSLEGVEKNYNIDWYKASEKEYTLSTQEDLYGFMLLGVVRSNKYKGKTVKVDANISLNTGKVSEWAKDAPMYEWFSIPEFAGTFDGQNHTISGIYVTSTQDYQGMFSQLAGTSVVRNLRLKNSYMTSSGKGLGSIAGLSKALIENVYSNAIVYNSNTATNTEGTGGIAGRTNDGTIRNCWFDGKATTDYRGVGGMVGRVMPGTTTIEHCLNTGTISKTDAFKTAARMGGLVGLVQTTSEASNLIVKDSLNAGLITSDISINQSGQLIGRITSSKEDVVGKITVRNSYSIAGCLVKEGKATEKLIGTALWLGVADDSLLDTEMATLPKDDLTGYCAYQNTMLNFAKYWTVVLEDTPVLKTFASKKVSLNGIFTYDVSWYNAKKDVYTIQDYADLQGLTVLAALGNDFAGKTILLETDITMNEGNATDWATTAPNYEWYPIATFAGTFDGQGHTIKGLYIDRDVNYQGLFGTISETGVVKNLKLENCYLSGSGTGMGSVAGLSKGLIENVYSEAMIYNTNTASNTEGTGGIAGRTNGGIIRNCWFAGSVTSDYRGVGGIVGRVMPGTTSIENCLNTGTISKTEGVRTAARMGGIVGMVQSSSKASNLVISDCVHAGLITSDSSINQSGQLLGLATCTTNEIVGTVTISNSYSVSGSLVKDEKVTELLVGLTNIAGKTTTSFLDLNAAIYQKDDLSGYSAYRNTLLDFETYWAVDLNGTPVLKTFASTQVSLDGIFTYDISWYNENANVYVLKDYADLQGVSVLAALGNEFVGKTFLLDSDITMNEENAEDYATTALNYEWLPIATFAGTFDGQGHTIRGLYIDRDVNYQGLFGTISETGVVKNLKLENCYLSGSGTGMGSVAGLSKGLIENVYSEAIIHNTNTASNTEGTGGIAGRTNGGIIRNCWFAGSATSDYRGVGGIVGRVMPGTTSIENCLNTGTISKTDVVRTAARMGGIVGMVQSSSKASNLVMSDCVNTGLITSDSSINQSGQLLGLATCTTNEIIGTVTISNSYSVSGSLVNGTTMTEKLIGESQLAGVNDTSFITIGAVIYPKDYMIGYAACRSTLLDFKTYWAVDLDGTPILQSFAESIPSLADEVTIDIDWYDESDIDYKINDYSDLLGVAVLSALGNEFEGKNILLTEDITINEGDASDWSKVVPEYKWITIGSSDVPFKGTFNGQGHTISGIYLNSTVTNQGMFGYVEGATIQDFKLKNSYLSSNKTRLGSIVGAGSVKLTGVSSDAYVVSTHNDGSSYIGGLVGRISDSSISNNISNCWFEGTVEARTAQNVGGIVGGATQDLKMEHCLSTGSIYSACRVRAPRVGGFCGYVDSNVTLTLEDSLYSGDIIFEYDTTNYTLEDKEGSQNQSGVIVGNSKTLSVDKVYTTTINAEIYGTETALGDTNYNKKNGVKGVTLVSDLTGFSGQNAELNYDVYWALRGNDVPILRTFETGGLLCTPDTDWYNEDTKTGVIADVDELYGFAKLSADGKDFEGATIKLGANITVNKGDSSTWGTSAPKYGWDPIGTKEVSFKGNFDGQGYTISGLYLLSDSENQGLFGYVKDAGIKNFRLENSYFECSYRSLGSVAGRGYATFENIYSNAYLTSTDTDQYARVGGIVGVAADGTTKIYNCWFNGAIDSSGAMTGGIIAQVSNTVEVKHCLNTGIIENSYIGKGNAGGICGYVSNNRTLTIEDSLSAGSLVIGESTTQCGTVIGYVETKGTATAKDVYGTTDKCMQNDVEITLGYNNGTVGDEGITPVSGDIKGKLAMTNAADLDYTNQWVVVPNEIPTLQVFRADTTWYAEATGIVSDEVNNPYTIDDAADFYGLALLSRTTDFAGKTIQLGADIVVNKDTSSTLDDWETYLANNSLNEWTAIGTESKPFKGTFDGCGYNIEGVYLNTNARYQGVFGNIAGATIRNFKLLNSYLESSDRDIGSIVGGGYGTVEKIYSNAVVVSTYSYKEVRVGGIWGLITTSTANIKECCFDGEIIAAGSHIGGFVGKVNNTVNLKYCHYTGSVYSSYTDGTPYIGGFVACVASGKTLSIRNSLYAGSISAALSTGTKTSIIVGKNDSTEAKVVLHDVYSTTDTFKVGTNLDLTMTQLISGSYTGNITVPTENWTGEATKTHAAGLFDEDSNDNTVGTDYWETVTDGYPILTRFKNFYKK